MWRSQLGSIIAPACDSFARLRPFRRPGDDRAGVVGIVSSLNLRLLFAFLLAFLAATAPRAAAQTGVDRAEASTVRVAVIVEAGEARTLIGTGSGFAVFPTLVVTNAHVVAPARIQDGAQVAIVAPGGDGMIPARIVSYSALADLALLEFRGGSRLSPVVISKVEPKPGEAIVALGYPDVDDLRRPPDELLQPIAPSRTTGAITSLRETAPTGDPVPTINHEAAISSGSSGGPLLDECGRVIGVNTWHARGRDTMESRAVATRAGQLLEFLSDAGIRAPQTEERCLTIAERAEADHASTIDALEAQNRELAAKIEAADRLTRMALVILIGGTVSLLVAVIVLGAIVFGRHNQAHANGHTHEPHPVSIRRGAPGVLAVVGGATVAAVLVVVAGIAIWRIQGLGAAPSAAEVFAGEQTCKLARSESRAVGDESEDAYFSAAGDLCVNGRTLYAPAARGRAYQRVLLTSERRALEVLTLDPRRREFRRERYPLNEDAYQAALATAGGQNADSCDASPAARAFVQQRNETLLRFAEGEPAQRLVWRCAIKDPGEVR